MKQPAELAQELGTAAVLIPERSTLESLRGAAVGCRACDLWEVGTQTVFGEGTEQAEVLFIGEQPGDDEDRAGRPFVGPAGRLLDRALDETGIDRKRVYVTNAVKHFRWEPRGKRRIHKTPNARQIGACRPWLEAEIGLVKPRVVVCLGATSAKALLGPGFRVSRHRGEVLESSVAPFVVCTVHPSSVLRAPDDETRRRQREAFVTDLQVVAEVLRSPDFRGRSTTG